MLNWIRLHFRKRKGRGLYREALIHAVEDQNLDDAEKDHLKNIVENHGLSVTDLVDAKKQAFSAVFDSICRDDKISDQENAALNSILTYFELRPEEVAFDQSRFNDCRIADLLERGELPVIKENSTGVILKTDEELHYGCAAATMKRKRITTRVNYGGPTVSIRIMKGVSYRLGSIGVQRVSQVHTVREDTGIFWITNGRIGFKGSRKNFAIPIGKIMSFEVSEGMLQIFKEGRENPYMLYLPSLDIPLKIFSIILNGRSEAKVA